MIGFIILLIFCFFIIHISIVKKPITIKFKNWTFLLDQIQSPKYVVTKEFFLNQDNLDVLEGIIKELATDILIHDFELQTLVVYDHTIICNSKNYEEYPSDKITRYSIMLNNLNKSIEKEFNLKNVFNLG